MNLSEAIRLGAMLKPQGFGSYSMYSKAQSCAFGAALDAIGVEREFPHGFVLVRDRWPHLWDVMVEMPVGGGGEIGLTDAVWILNDEHRWTREQIADWVETVEKAQDMKAEPEPVAVNA